MPLLLVSAAADTLVNPASHGPVVARLRHGKLATIAGARHEVMMETDAMRAAFWTAFDQFAQKTCGAS